MIGYLVWINVRNTIIRKSIVVASRQTSHRHRHRYRYRYCHRYPAMLMVVRIIRCTYTYAN